jgi:hypothetical protein
MTELTIGQQTADGIYIGQYEAKSLGKIFNVFAAPQNLFEPEIYQGLGRYGTYDAMVSRISKLKNWHGFDGTDYATAEVIHQALKEDSYKGGWVIPTCEMLKENLKHIKQALMKVDAHNDIYWSSTEHAQFKNNVYAQRQWDGYDAYHPKSTPAHCRPVRLVPVAP